MRPAAGAAGLGVLAGAGMALAGVSLTGAALAGASTGLGVATATAGLAFYLPRVRAGRQAAAQLGSEAEARRRAEARADMLRSAAAAVGAMAGRSAEEVARVCVASLEICGFELAAVCLLDPDGPGHPVATSAELESAPRLRAVAAGRLTRLVLDCRSTVVVDDKDLRTGFEGCEGTGLRLAIASPMRQADQIVGALVAGTRGRDRATDEDLELVDLLAGEASRAWDGAVVAATVDRSEAWFRSLVQHSSELVAVIDAVAGAVYVSPASDAMLGYQPEELLGEGLVGLIHPDDTGAVAAAVAGRASNGVDLVTLSARARHRDGSWRRLRLALRDLTGDAAIGGVVLNMRDVTDEQWALTEARIRNEQAHVVAALGQRALSSRDLAGLLDEAVRQVASILDVSLVSLFEVTPGGQHMVLRAGVGWDEGEVGRSLVPLDEASREWIANDPAGPEVVHDPRGDGTAVAPGLPLLDRHGVHGGASVAVAHRGRLFGALSVHTRGGRVFPQPDIDFLVGVANVIGAAVEAEEAATQLQEAALHDSLTGLPNRALFLDRLAHALSHLRRRAGFVAVLFLDLDRFKSVNDRFGHAFGDSVLRAVAERLAGVTRPSDTTARLGGDEFVVTCEDIEDEAEADTVAGNLLTALRPPLHVGDHEVFVTASIGVVLGRGGEDPMTMLRNADAAMYQAKHHGRDRVERYDEEMRNRAIGAAETGDALRRAIELAQLSLAYQPEVDLRTGEVVAIEALARWNHPVLGRVPPRVFIPVAEDAGLINAVGEWVLAEACRQVQEWRQAIRPDLRVSVNISVNQVVHSDLVSTVDRILASTGLAPTGLVLELTETALMDDAKSTQSVVAALERRGVRLAIDDFGTGHSSLARLKAMPVHAVKVERAFVAGMGTDSEDEAIVEAVVGMAHALGKTVVAEGVETRAQLNLLRRAGVDVGQGYYWSRPVKAMSMARWLRSCGGAATFPAGRSAQRR